MAHFSEGMLKVAPTALPAVVEKSYLPQIDALRGLAALGVLFFHLYEGVYPHAELRPLMVFSDLRSHRDLWRWLAAPCLFGYAGVPLFFVISGFCIHYSFLNSRRPFSFLPFMGRRFWRIYPAYLFAISLALFLPGNPIWKTHHLPKSLLLHLLFLHNLNHTTIFELSGPFWTLAVEFQFYIAFPFFLMLRRWLGVSRAALGAMCLCTIVSFALHRGWIGHFGLQALPVMFWVQWCLGALIAERFFDGQGPLINLPFAVGIWAAGVLLAVPLEAYSEWNYLAWAMLCAAAIEWWIRRRTVPRGKDAANCSRMSMPLVVWLGTISYSVYLLHAIVLGQILPRIPISGSRFVIALLVVLPVVIVASAISYHLIELPGMMIGRKCVALCFPRESSVALGRAKVMMRGL
jgi:peptidoglycan/LPS O-acetylase OafA/YrhL